MGVLDAVRVGRDLVRLGHPVAVEDMRQDGDPVQGLDPVGGVPAGDHQPGREAVERRQRLAVHRVGHRHLGLEGVVDVERLDEIGHRGERPLVEPVERHLHGVPLAPPPPAAAWRARPPPSGRCPSPRCATGPRRPSGRTGCGSCPNTGSRPPPRRSPTAGGRPSITPAGGPRPRRCEAATP